VSVHLSVRRQAFESIDAGSAHPVHLEIIRVKFVYEGHRIKVKVKVSGAENVGNPYFRNFKTSISNDTDSIKPRAARFACSIWFSDMVDGML